jgi:flagellar biosynthesis protein FlgN
MTELTKQTVTKETANKEAVTKEAVKNHLRQDINACQNLLNLLEGERQALKARNPQLLEEVIQNKTALLLHLEQSAKQRGQWVSQSGASQKSEAVWLDLLRKLDPATEDTWLEFKDLLKTCQEQNEINGKLLARNQQVFDRLLAIVRGQSENGPLYTAKGNRGAGYNFQKLGEA